MKNNKGKETITIKKILDNKMNELFYDMFNSKLSVEYPKFLITEYGNNRELVGLNVVIGRTLYHAFFPREKISKHVGENN